MKHVSTIALLAGAIELKGDDDPTETVTKALADLTKTVDDRIKGIESKTADMTKIVERLDALEKKANRPGADKTGQEPDEAAAIQRKSFASYMRFGAATPAEDIKALIVSSDPQGGYLAPNEMATEMLRDITQYSPIRGLASVRTTSQPGVTYPKRTGITNGAWHGEQQSQTSSDVTFGQVDIPTRELNTYVDISNQLLADSGGAAESEVRLALAEDFGKKEGVAFVKGAGTLDPEGILVASGVAYKASGNASTLGSAPADLLIDLLYSLAPAYRGRSTWLMNGTTLATVRKLKDTTGQFLWQPSIAAGQPETILGRPVVEDPEMPDIGASTEPIALGDFESGYRIVDRLSLSILVNPYLLATSGLTRIHATRRVGGKVIVPAAIKKIRCATS